MRHRRSVLVLVALAVVLAGCGGLPGSVPDTPDTGSVTTAPPTPPSTTAGPGPDGETPTPAPEATPTSFDYADPGRDRLGWEGGYWHNESVAVDRSDGLNDAELAAVVNRSMARVEYVRGLEFERPVPVEVISRAAYRNRTDGRSYSSADRLHQNVKWEATFMIGESTDALGVQDRNRGAAVRGFYSPADERIVVVSENASDPELDEITLAQELFHALQDQRFGLAGFDQSTRELHNARDGVIEGDGNYVDHLYEQRCGAEWDCLSPRESGSSSSSGGSPDVHVGLYQVTYQPYSDGVVFVQERRQRLGWDGVDALYERPPNSTEQTIHPALYGVDEPAPIAVPDRSADRWRVPDVGPVDYAAFGEAGLFVTLWYPSYVESQAAGRPRDVVIPYRAHLNYTPDGSELAELDPYSYSHPASAGWGRDRLVPYVTNDSAATNETGYVWKTVWDSPSDARQFADAYVALLAYHNATDVDAETDGPGTVYRIPEGEPFADAFRVVRANDTVVVTNAPSVAELRAVRDPPDAIRSEE